MSSSLRRRAAVETMVCAAIVAALAVQPALGEEGQDFDRGGDGQARERARSMVPPGGGDPGFGSPRQAPAPPAATGARDPGSESTAGSRRGSDRGRSAPAVAAPVTASGGDYASSGRGGGRGGSAPTLAAPVPPPPAPAEGDARVDDARRHDSREDRRASTRGRDRGERPEADSAIAPQSTGTDLNRDLTSEGALPTTPAANAPAPETAVAAHAGVATSPPAAGAAPPASPRADSPVRDPARSSTVGARSAVGARSLRSDAGRRVTPGEALAQLPGTAGAAAAVTAPATPLSAPPDTPAAAAIELAGVREAGRASTSRLPPGATDDVPGLGSPQTGPISRAVANVIEVIPTLIWIALAALGALVTALAAHSMLAAARTRRLERQRELLMEDIGLLQAALLPKVPSRIGALLTTVAYRPADGPAAGGDFYDAFALSGGRVGLLLGDVSGHGRQALARTTLVRHSVRAHLMAGMAPREAIAVTGRALDGQLADDFATVLAAIHDPAAGTLTYASAGHPPPVVIGPPAHTPVTASSAPPIGVGFPTGQRQTVLPMPGGSTVAVLSDGLLEARVDGVPLGAERLAAWLAELGPEATARQLLDLAVQRADSVPDDLAAVVLHAAPGAAAPAARIEQLKLDVLDVEGPDLDGFLEGAGVGRSERSAVGRRVSEQLAVTGGVIVEVMTGEHPKVTVAPIGDRAGAAAARVTPAG